MKHRYMLWGGHLAVLALLACGLWWLIPAMPGMPDYRIFIALVAMTSLVFNHVRWWMLSRQVDEKEILDKIDLLVMANYCTVALILSLVEFGK